MSQSRYSVLVSIALLLALTVGFFLASKALFDRVHRSIESAAATSTPIIVVSSPTPLPRTTATAPKKGKPRKSKQPQLQPTATPAASSVQVQIGTSLQASDVGTSFPTAKTGTLYCIASVPPALVDTPVTLKWESMPSGNEIFSYPWTSSSTIKYTYLTGPEAPGQYRCQVFAPVGGQLQVVGSASFTVTS